MVDPTPSVFHINKHSSLEGYGVQFGLLQPHGDTHLSYTQLESLPELMWKDITVPEKQTVRSHKCELIKRKYMSSGWKCDLLKGARKCFSGITGFYQTSNIQGWRCDGCDFDLCIKCMQVDNLVMNLVSRDEEALQKLQ